MAEVTLEVRLDTAKINPLVAAIDDLAGLVPEWIPGRQAAIERVAAAVKTAVVTVASRPIEIYWT